MVLNTKESTVQNNFSIILLLFPIVMILIFSFSILKNGTPEFKVDKTQHGLKVGKIFGKLNPIQAGDLIKEIHGIKYHLILSMITSPSMTPNQDKTICIIRDGELITLIPKVNSVTPFRLLSEAWPHFTLMITLISLGIIAFLRVPIDQPGFVFLIFLSMIATTISATLPSYFGILSPQIISLSFFTLAICNWIGFSAFFHFVFSFPNERNLVSNHRWLIPLIYILVPFISIILAWSYSNGGNDFWGWLQRFRNITLPFISLAIFIKHIIDYKILKTTIEKNQIKLIISAYWLSFGPYIVFYAIPNIMLNRPLISFKLVAISGLILPIAYFISLIRYRLLDVDRLISRTVSYFVLIGILASSYSYLAIVLKRTFLNNQIFSDELFLIYIILIAILFGPMIRLISMGFDKLLIPKTLYRYGMVSELTRRIGSTIHLKDLIDLLTQSIPKEFSIKKLSFIIFEESSYQVYPKGGSLQKTKIEFDTIKMHLKDNINYLFCNELESDSELKKTLSNLSETGYELIFPLRGGTGFSGMLLLGRRVDERLYSKKDIQFFTTISNQAGLALENSLHYDSVVKGKQQIEKMFKKVVQSEKMAALGEMSTILAHELKNPLGIIRSSAQYLTKNIDDSENRHELLDYIVSEVDGLESSINNMMGLARYKSPRFKTIDLHKKLSVMVAQWVQSGNHNRLVSIDIDCPSKLPEINADFQQLQQVFLNCIANSEDAISEGDMSEGGQIRIKLISKKLGMIEIEIVDTGPGIPESNVDNAFKKFFTTKEKGMGIGLSVCKQIITAHNGTISIKNSNLSGLSVLITIPCDPLSIHSQPEDLKNIKEISIA